MRKVFIYSLLSAMIVSVSGSIAFAQEKDVERDPKDFVYQSNEKRDPFWELVNSNGVILNYDSDFSISDLSLEGIFTDAKRGNVAIINGKVLKVGAVIGKFVIITITENVVTLKKGDKNFDLRLKKEE